MNRIDDIYKDYSHFKDLLSRMGIYQLLDDDNLTDIAINEYGKLLIKDLQAKWISKDAPGITESNCLALKNYLLSFNNNKTMDVKNPSEAVTFPSGERCHILIPPIADKGLIMFAIRKFSEQEFTLEEYKQNGKFDNIEDLSPSITNTQGLKKFQKELLLLKNEKNWIDFFKLAVSSRLNIAIAGGLGSGKTTFHKTLVNLIDDQLRIAVIETNREIPLKNHMNTIHMYYSKDKDSIPASRLIKDILRLMVDIPIIAELSGEEAWDLQEILNVGHSGGIFTIHSNNAIHTYDRFTSLCKSNELCISTPREDILKEVKATIDLSIYMRNKEVVEIYYNPQNKLVL